MIHRMLLIDHIQMFWMEWFSQVTSLFLGQLSSRLCQEVVSLALIPFVLRKLNRGEICRQTMLNDPHHMATAITNAGYIPASDI